MKDKLRIDKNALDEDLIGQPGLFREAGYAYAEAVSTRDALDEERKKVRAELSIGMEGRVADVAAKVESHKLYRKALGKYLVAKKNADDAWVDREAFQQRAFVLKELAHLYVAGYFGTDTIRGSDSRVVQQMEYDRDRREMSEQRRERTQKRSRL